MQLFVLCVEAAGVEVVNSSEDEDTTLMLVLTVRLEGLYERSFEPLESSGGRQDQGEEEEIALEERRCSREQMHIEYL